jgi:hypothetical protein
MRIGLLKRGRNSVKLARLIRHDSNGGSGSFGAISHRNDRRARLRSGAQGDSDEEDTYSFVCSIDSGVNFADARGRGMLWLRRRRWPAGRLCCRRNSWQRIGKTVSICLLWACSGLLWLLRAGAVLWLLALATRVPLSSVLSCEPVRSASQACNANKPLGETPNIPSLACAGPFSTIC